MLAVFLPSWLQDLWGTAATLKSMSLVSLGPLLPLLLIIPIVVSALLLARRSEASNGAPRDTGGSRCDAPGGVVERHAFEPAPGSSAPGAFGGRAAAMPPPAARHEEAALVLIVDDSALIRAKLSRVLAFAGFRVAEANDGQQALDLMRDGLVPSVLITDLEMPGIDGFGLIAAVHGALETEHLPIVAITGHDDLQARVADLGGIYGIFKKPWNDRALIQRIRTLTAIAEAETGAAA